MKNVFLTLLLATALGCSVKDKIVEKAGQSLILSAMTNGQWKVSNYDKAGTNVTSDFSTYSFQFKTNYTVDAINSGSVQQSGNWNATGDAQAQSITANFSNATNPLVLLNGTWNISSTTWTSVDATQTVNGELRTLRLDKQ
jgi:hypothetical protein